MHAPLDALSTTFIKTTCKEQPWVGSKHIFAGNSWRHVKQVEQGSMDMTQSMKHQVGRTNNARKGVDESVWAVQLVEHAGKEVMEEKWSCWNKTEPGRSTRPPRPVGPGRPASPIKGPPGSHFLHANIPLIPLFVCSSFCAQNHCRHSQPSQV
jgi:hypothetical protein